MGEDDAMGVTSSTERKGEGHRGGMAVCLRSAGSTPGSVTTPSPDRLFLGRSVHHLAADVGIRQFLDIGTGLPSADNTREVAQRAAADARIVYVDNDPLEIAHARALLISTPDALA